ncbi:MAG: TrkH family potassium uptake protein [Chitinivibrionales bacterium]|nr:TrkH family potassium uptake protein [Chitinivibrionales bacterium]
MRAKHSRIDHPAGAFLNQRFVIYAIGKLLQVLALVLCIPALIAWFDLDRHSIPEALFDPRLAGFAASIIASLLAGTLLILFFGKKAGDFGGVKEGFAIVTFGWLLCTLFGSIPLFVYLLDKAQSVGPNSIILGFTNAYFEIMSGFTTTGATILTDIEILPRGILFWRSMTHWLGGMGIVTLALVFFPAFGVAAYQMFRGEVPGPSTERLRPRLGQTASILWGVYFVLTLAETILLMFGGMDWFEASCHAFGTMATGGFSTKNASIAAYNSDYIDWVIIVFMFFAGMNFIIHYRVLFHRDLSLIRTNSEFRFYVAVIVLAIVFGTSFKSIYRLAPEDAIKASYRSGPLSRQELERKVAQEEYKQRSLYHTIRYVSFQVISITTTTGYATADFDMWPNILRVMLVVLMFFGGCAGSTGGGMKMIRVMTVLKSSWREVRTMIQPRLILPVKIGGTAIEEKQVANIAGFFVLFLLLFVFFSVVMSLMVPDFATAITTVVATMCNIGPGLSGIGATENYAWIPVIGKWVLIMCMLLGRLEIYTVIIAFSPIAWKR